MTEFDKVWYQETWRIQEVHPLLSWEACEMIAYNRIQERLHHEDNDWKVSEEG